MATNYGELRAELSTYEFHQRFAADYASCTLKFEAAANRRLRVRQMETVALLTTVNGDTTLPLDYLVWRTVLRTVPALTTMPRQHELDYVHPAYLQTVPVTSGISVPGAVRPQVFTIEGNAFRVRPVDDSAPYELHYYQKIPTITGGDPSTNWLLDANSDVYLYGVLLQLTALGRNQEMAQLYKAWRDEVFQEIIQLSALTTGATSPMVRTAEYF